VPERDSAMTSTSRHLRSIRVLLGGLIGLVGAACQADPTLPPETVARDDGARRNTSNVAPTALFTVSPRWPRPGDTVTFDASYSLDRDGTVVAYEWNLGNGTTQVSGARARTVYTRAGTFEVSVGVVDDSGSRATRSLALTVSSATPPALAVDSAQSLVVAASTSLLASASTLVTVTARNALGVPVPGVPVWVGGIGRDLRVTQPSASTNALGIASGSITSPATQIAQVVAIADYTLLRPVALSIGATSLSLTRTSVRLTDPVVSAAGDTSLLEVTARDTAGNPIIGATVTASVAGGTSTVRNEGPTDANGRRVIVIEPTSCSGTVLSVSASVNGTTVGTPSTITASPPASYGVCGAALWLDADDATSVQQTGGLLTGWQDKSGASRHATASSGPAVLAAAFNGRTAMRFNGVNQFVPIADVVSASPYTVFVVERRRSARSANYVLGGTATVTSSNLLLGYHAASTLRLSSYSDQLDAAAPAFTSASAEPGRVLVGRWSNGARSLLSNGAVLASDASPNPLAGWAGAAIGRANADGTLAYYDGDVGEVLLFRRAISDADRTTIVRGLMRKWSLGTLTLTAGNNQTASVGAAVSTSPQVRVVDDAGVGVAGATIVWQVTAGGGSTTTATSTTDANGFANVSWTLGTAGTNTLVAWYGPTQGTGQSVTFTATASSCVYGVCSPSLWLDAQDASSVTLSGSRVTQWRDKSSAGLIAVPSAGDVGPTYPTSGTVLINGRRAMGFDAAVALASMRISPTLAPGITVYVVGRSVASLWNAHGWLANARGANGFIIHPDNALRQLTPYIVNASGTYTALPSVTPADITIPHLYGLSYASPSALAILDGAATASTVTVTRGSTAVDLFIGSDKCCSGRYGTGSFGELVIYNRALSTAERQLVERSLMARWGIGTFAIASGNGQSAPAGTSPGVAPAVRLTDATGAGIGGSPVTWQVTAGGARFGAGITTFSTVTDGTGFATVPLSGAQALTLAAGSNQITAWLSATAGQGRSVVFTLTGTP